MPRTKKKSKTIKKQVPENVNVDKRTQEIDAYLKEFDFNCKHLINNVDLERDIVLQELNVIEVQIKSLVSPQIGNTSLEDLRKGVTDPSHFITASDSVTHSTILELTDVVKSIRANKTRRSVSAKDHGAEISEHSGGTRRSRIREKQFKVTRASRSLSRTKPLQNQLPFSTFKTPANKATKNDYGPVTPKVKPNTPQVILRRPIDGEIAISMQGSPLMVNHFASREANVNIPLDDGRTISIQPQHGLRMSELPNIDSSIRRQIEVLRDNLIKVCQAVTDNERK